MKYILFLLSLSLSILTLAQPPKTISYQGVARNATGQPIPNQPIKIKLSLLETATSTTSLYTETHTLSTTAQGLFAIQIGAGTVLSGTYATLDWSNGPKFVKTEIDPTGGDNFNLSSTNPLNAVPFALFAQSGTPGPQGPAGATGPQGPAGEVGATGPQGPIGLTGPQGPSGAVGPQGPAGQMGATGIQGPIGQTGPTGATGAKGDKGDTGAQGPIGLTGPTGATGAQGPIGLIGPAGPTGSGYSNGTTTNQMMYWNGTAWTTLNPGSNGQTLTLCNGVLTWTTGGICPASLPSLTTTTTTTISSTTASSGGNISSDGGSNIIARGVCWSTSQNPTIALTTKTNEGTGTGTFISSLTGLSPNTTYFVRAFATNSAGTAYGNEISFSTPVLVNPVDADGNTYTTVTIGTQIWMKENLKVSKFNNGEPIVSNLSNSQWRTASTAAYSISQDLGTNNITFGKLYNWYAVADPRGLCPSGWHVPSDLEWGYLQSFLGGDSLAGGKMKETGTIQQGNGWWQSPNVEASNESGFSARPGGLRDGFDSGGYTVTGFNGYFWTSTEYAPGFSWAYYLINSQKNLLMNGSKKAFGFSVRCLKD